jgi:heme-degrading monooxygenase HmoA
MFLSISQFTVANALDDEVRKAFLHRPHHVEKAPGFIRMEVANLSLDSKVFWLMTWWDTAESFENWHSSHAFKASHAGIPKGLKLDPKQTALIQLEVFAQ